MYRAVLLSPPVIALFGILMLSLLVLHSYVKGTLQTIVALLLHILSVFGFFSFLFYFHAFLNTSCSPEVTQTIVIATVLFVLLSGLFFYYVGRKRI